MLEKIQVDCDIAVDITQIYNSCGLQIDRRFIAVMEVNVPEEGTLEETAALWKITGNINKSVYAVLREYGKDL